MNRRERDDLLQFLEPLLRARATDKDPAAETLIREQCARQPDALYLLVQRALALESALQAAQAELARRPDSSGSPPATQEGAPPAPAARQEAGDRGSAWGRGLLAQTGAIGLGVGLGVTAGVVAGGWLLDALEDGFGEI